jgi:hypothetical protein
MKKLLYFVFIGIATLTLWSCKKSQPSPLIVRYVDTVYIEKVDTTAPNPKNILAEVDSIQIIQEVIDSTGNNSDNPIKAIWLRNKNTGDYQKLFQTRPPKGNSWYTPDGKKWKSVSINDIPGVFSAYIIIYHPLQFIVEGCPDGRNIYSYYIDAESRTAKYIPANSGYMGETEEGYLVFKSYRYVSNPDIAGRYTILQLFNQDGILVEKLDLEHIKLEEYKEYLKTHPEDAN